VSSAGLGRPSSLTSEVVPILRSKLRKAHEASKSLMGHDLGYCGCETMGGVVAPKGQQTRSTPERVGNCWPGLAYDAVNHFSPTVSDPIQRESGRLVSALRDSNSEQDRFGGRSTHGAAPQISIETMARDSFGRSLREPGTKLRRELAEHLRESVRIGEKMAGAPPSIQLRPIFVRQ